MAYPSVRSSRSAEGASTAAGVVAVVLPATVSAGDTLIVVLAQDGGSTLNVGTSGFTRLAYRVYSTYVGGAVFYKKADGYEDGATVSFAGANSLQYAYTTYAFQGAADASVTPPTVSAYAEGSNTAPAPPNCNPGVSKDYYWLATAQVDRRAVTGYPADMTLDRLTAGTAATLNASAASAGRQSAGSAYDPSGVFTVVSDEWICWTVAIHPPPAQTLAGTVVAAGSMSDAVHKRVNMLGPPL